MTTKITIKDKAINSVFQDEVGTTSGAGTGAKFDVTKTNGVYTVALDSIALSAGAGYAPGDTITVLGSRLGGVDATNDLIITVATVGAAGKIATFGSVGTGRVGDGVVDIAVEATGTAGIDTFAINGLSTEFSLTNSNGKITAQSNLVSNFEYVLPDHERVTFTDKFIAFDTTGTAGDIYSILGAGLGVSRITPELIGAGLYLKETAGWTDKQLAKALISLPDWAVVAGGTSDETFVKFVWKNIFGVDATYAQTKEITDLMSANGYDQADILLVAANNSTFQQTIDLVGMQTTGIAGVTYAG